MKRALLLTFLVALGMSSWLGWLGAINRTLGAGRLQKSNDTYLTSSFNRALTGFGTMSMLKAGLDIIEGSEIGASFGVTANLQVGDVVQPAYDYVDIAWRTLLTGCITLLSIKYILQAASILDGYLLGVTLICLAAYLSVRWWRPDWTVGKRALRDILAVTVVSTLALSYILPVSVWGASRLSRIITEPAIEEAQKGFEQTRQFLFPDDQKSPDGMVAKLKQMQDRLEQIATNLKDKSKDMVIWSITLITGYIFDCIIFPLVLFTLLLWLTRSVMRYLLQVNMQSTLRDDLSSVLIKSQRKHG